MRNAGEKTTVAIIGAGLAGSEAAWQLAQRAVNVRLYEMRPRYQTPAHQGEACAELVCSNSLKSLLLPSAAATLKHELASLGSFVMRVALKHRLPAGQALAVDRQKFAAEISCELNQHPRIQVIHKQIQAVDEVLANNQEQIIIATGPLTAKALACNIATTLGSEHLAFYDAAAPIVEADSLDHSQLFAQSRYNKAGADYLNAALDKELYEQLVIELCQAQRVVRRSFERHELFVACQPVEEVARTGPESLRHGALKPFGLCAPDCVKPPYAVVQLRAENPAKTAYNLVGFQTNLTFGEQQRIFRLIPGLAQARFSRLGVMHRNTFINAPHALGSTLELPANPRIRFAGQLTGTEGYTEAIASGLFAALNCYARILDVPPVHLPAHSCFGALLAYATNPDTRDYQPMHVNYGIMEPLASPPRQKRQRYAAYSLRALQALANFKAVRSELNFAPSYLVPDLATTAVCSFESSPENSRVALEAVREPEISLPPDVRAQPRERLSASSEGRGGE
ncbi:MAG: methylenetetrahydrofolate--tRNA-(uracil(54)-C(5))-methyltransferase (FADH(2)-oxidizing) TrmFO [Coriobacteriales bacterium]|nr:methylenetetrahydrofolate--tRNA-(uracil(54)-C(5))-methyltransferase (FADH(2)-oxidizing) TrmFO [Coriobacteriales bacterium]